MKLDGNLQLAGDLKARNFPQEVKDFYGITVKQVRTSDGNIHSYSGISLISFNDESFYLEQNTPNTDEVIVNFKGGSGVTAHSALTGLIAPADDHTQYALADRSRPTLWNVKITDGTNIQTDDTVNFNKNDFYVSANLTGQPVINVNNKSAALFFLSTNQVTNLSAGDHLKFDLTGFIIGNSISLDSTTAYTSASGASIGRITLQPNKTYEISAAFRPTFTAATDSVSAQITNDSGVSNPLGSRMVISPLTSTSLVYNQTVATAIVAPSVATRYELRLLTSTGVTTLDGSTTIPGSFIKVIEL
jgi:hypothetical protein